MPAASSPVGGYARSQPELDRGDLRPALRLSARQLPPPLLPGRAAPHRAADFPFIDCVRPLRRPGTPKGVLSPFGVRHVSIPSFSGAAGVALLRVACASPRKSTETVTVTAEKLAAARNGIQTQTGASTYTITAKDIQDQPGGDNAPLNSVILQAPGVAQDSFGQLHVRGEHNGLQYRLNGIILPEGISVFGQTLDPRLAESVRLITGALPAEYGNRTAGIIDIQTKSGVFDDGGEVSVYGGSHSTLSPSIAYGGSSGHFNYFVSGDYTTNTLGIESPDGSSDPLHDRTKQYHGFAFLQDILDQNSSVTAMLGTSNAMFQIPNQRRPAAHRARRHCRAGTAGSRQRQFRAERQWRDRLSVAKIWTSASARSPITASSAICIRRDRWTIQISAFGRYSSLYFTPGNNVGDILYNGLAQTAYKRDVAYGLQAEGAWHLGDRPHHPLRRAVSGRRYLSATPVAGAADGSRRRQAIPIPIRFAPIPPRPARPRRRR